MRPRGRLGGVLAIVVLLGACARNDTAAPPTPPAPDFAALPACPEQPSAPPHDEVPGLELPTAATVFSVYDVGVLTQAEGMVDMTPVEVRAFYEQHDDLQVLIVEDERVESEILVTDGTYRMFVKAQIACATASNFTATVGTEAQAAAIPTPAGSPSPAGTPSASG